MLDKKFGLTVAGSKYEDIALAGAYFAITGVNLGLDLGGREAKIVKGKVKYLDVSNWREKTTNYYMIYFETPLYFAMKTSTSFVVPVKYVADFLGDGLYEISLNISHFLRGESITESIKFKNDNEEGNFRKIEKLVSEIGYREAEKYENIIVNNNNIKFFKNYFKFVNTLLNIIDIIDGFQEAINEKAILNIMDEADIPVMSYDKNKLKTRIMWVLELKNSGYDSETIKDLYYKPGGYRDVLEPDEPDWYRVYERSQKYRKKSFN